MSGPEPPERPASSKRKKQRLGEPYAQWLLRTQGIRAAPGIQAAPHPAPAEAARRMGDAPEIQPLKGSAEFQQLMEMVMLGVMSAAASNRIAVGHETDAKAMGNRMHPEMEMLAALGAHGRHPIARNS